MYNTNNYGNPQQQFTGQPGQQPQQQQSGGRQQRAIVGGWTAQQYGMEYGKHIEYIVERVEFKNGGGSNSVLFYKPYRKNDGTEGRGFSFMEGALKELVERINHYMMNYAKNKGVFVFQPMANPQPAQQYQAPLAPPQYPQQVGYPQQQQPMQQQQPVPGYPPQYNPPAPQQPQQQQAQPLPPPGYPPQNQGGGGW